MFGRKPLLYFSIVVATVGFFGHWFIDSNPEQEKREQGLVDSERTGMNYFLSQTQPAGVAKPGVHPAPGDDDYVRIEGEGKVYFQNQNVVVWGNIETDLGEVVAGEAVAFYSESLNERFTTISGSNGEFVITDIKAATDYRVIVSPRGMYKRYTKSPVDVSFNQVVHNIILETLPVGVLSGKVVDFFDRPVPSFELTIRTEEKDNWSIDAMTDESGVFSVIDFPKGGFQVSSGSMQSFQATGFYFDPDDIDPVIVNVDIGPYSLSGHIYDESGKTIDGANVVVVWTAEDDDVTSESTRQATTDTSGAFRFFGLGPGDHELIVFAWGEGAFKQTVRQNVNLGVDSGQVNVVLKTH
ncbi:MAG: carboxypeptidase-like regulatory domain-containing protein [Arenicellales bacterium]|nr:carboxypeptidase-like regulatory domain-containing protein [Arenicellales bacterium]